MQINGVWKKILIYGNSALKVIHRSKWKVFKSQQNKILPRTIILITLGVLFYFLTCGVDSYFQSQTYTFGLCGPLDISAKVGSLNCKAYVRFSELPINLVYRVTNMYRNDFRRSLWGHGLIQKNFFLPKKIP